MNFIFGYLKPYRNELKLKHLNEYKKAYCTLCYGLRKNTGFLSTVLLNYESVFLYIFLEGLSDNNETSDVKFRCPTNPLKKVESEIDNQLLEYASYINYSLILLKVIDNCRDSNNVLYKLGLALLSRNKKYSKLRQKYNHIDAKIRGLYDELYQLEKNNCQDFDECSATMGKVLCEIVEYYLLTENIECEDAKDFAKHLGMWIYLIDAYDDYEKDIKKRTFNPLYTFKNSCCTDKLNSNFHNSRLIYAEVMLRMMIENMNELLIEINVLKHTEIIDNVIKYATINEVKRIKQKRMEKHKKCKK